MSASSKTKCPKCRFVVKNVDSICCDNCLNWFHFKCSKLSRATFNKFVSDQSLQFVCNFCTKFPCGKCNKGVFEYNHAICCDSSNCNKLYHLKCTKVSLPFTSISNCEFSMVMPRLLASSVTAPSTSANKKSLFSL